jgi:hypothetical protein
VHAASGPDVLAQEARWLQQRLRRRAGERDAVSTDDAGRLLVLASLVLTRDVAWAEIDRESSGDHVEVWRELVRRGPDHLIPGAAGLLAFSAWQHGDGALAWCALDRCLAVDPDYSMAHCVADILTAAIPPGLWDGIPEHELPVFASRDRPRTGADQAS